MRITLCRHIFQAVVHAVTCGKRNFPISNRLIKQISMFSLVLKDISEPERTSENHKEKPRK